MDDSFVEELKALVQHMWVNRHLSNLGYDSMSIEMKNTFNAINCKPVGDRNV